MSKRDLTEDEIAWLECPAPDPDEILGDWEAVITQKYEILALRAENEELLRLLLASQVKVAELERNISFMSLAAQILKGIQ